MGIDKGILDPWRDTPEPQQQPVAPDLEQEVYQKQQQSKLRLQFVGSGAGITVWGTNDPDEGLERILSLVDACVEAKMDVSEWGIYFLTVPPEQSARGVHLKNRVFIQTPRAKTDKDAVQDAIKQLSLLLQQANRQGVPLEKVVPYLL